MVYFVELKLTMQVHAQQDVAQEDIVLIQAHVPLEMCLCQFLWSLSLVDLLQCAVSESKLKMQSTRNFWTNTKRQFWDTIQLIIMMATKIELK